MKSLYIVLTLQLMTLYPVVNETDGTLKTYTWPHDEKPPIPESVYRQEKAKLIGRVLENNWHQCAQAERLYDFIQEEKRKFNELDVKDQKRLWSFRIFAYETVEFLLRNREYIAQRPQLSHDADYFRKLLEKGHQVVYHFMQKE